MRERNIFGWKEGGSQGSKKCNKEISNLQATSTVPSLPLFLKAVRAMLNECNVVIWLVSRLLSGRKKLYMNERWNHSRKRRALYTFAIIRNNVRNICHCFHCSYPIQNLNIVSLLTLFHQPPPAHFQFLDYSAHSLLPPNMTS